MDTFTTLSLPAPFFHVGRLKWPDHVRDLFVVMNPRERANWFDTEGNLYTSPVEKPLRDSIVAMCVGQQDRSPLDAFALGLHRNGIECRITKEAGNGQGFRLTISRMEDIAKEVTLELPFIRNQKKLDQIYSFVNFVRRERQVARQSSLKALQMVSGLEPPRSPNRGAMDPMDRANWFETEGCLSSSLDQVSEGTGAQFIVSQAESSPLECYAVGCLNDGVETRLYSRRRQHGIEHILRIRRLDHIALEVSKELPYFRMEKSLNQVRSFIDFIHLPRRRVSKTLELARLVLPRGPVV